jgi:hypothetical protein
MKRSSRNKAVRVTLAVMLCGNLAATSCSERLSTAAVDGSKAFFFELLNDAAAELLAGVAPESTS